MTINKNKVISLPNSVKKQGYEFICPCPVCIDKVHRDELKYINLQEVKNTIEDIIDSTVLYRKEFQIDLSYSADNFEQKFKDIDLIERVPEMKKILYFTNDLLLFCKQFNKNYRHPLVCELKENMRIVATQVGSYLQLYDGKPITNQRLWDFQSVVSTLNGISEILSDVQREEIFQSTKISTFLKTIKDTRKQSGVKLKTMFVEGLYSDKVRPHDSQQNFSLEYGY